MSQITSFLKAVKACSKDSVRVSSVAVTLRKAQAPTGRGSRTSPAWQSRV